MDFDTRKAAALAWYVHLAAQPGWKEYAWRAVNDLARDWPSEFGDLPALLTAAMRESADAAH